MTASPSKLLKKASVVDLFSGAGGLSFGFKKVGFEISAGVDIDESCRYAYEHNNKASFIRRDVASTKSDEIQSLFSKQKIRILVGCAPCQPFSTYNQKNSDPNWRLLKNFGRLATEVLPEIVSMENVAALTRFQGGKVFRDFVRELEAHDYTVNWDILFGPDYGLAQTRSRLVLLASRLGPIELPRKTRRKYRTVRDAISILPALAAGEIDQDDPLHRASGLSDVNLRRIRSSRPGGSWRDWSDNLIAECHKQETGRGYSSVYGRMEWDEPSPTITTQYYGFGNGRFGHPEQDRALSLREGAILQGFPRNYRFVADDAPITFKSVGRLVGNAVPVDLASAIARAVHKHIKEYA